MLNTSDGGWLGNSAVNPNRGCVYHWRVDWGLQQGNVRCIEYEDRHPRGGGGVEIKTDPPGRFTLLFTREREFLNLI